MRYTEAKLQKISSLMLDDIKKDTVDFQENYDGSEIEPKVLPSKLPNLLINGSTGIAVGMATSIPPHNLIEVLNASKALLLNAELTPIDLMEYIKAPDFPTHGILVNNNEMPSVYKTGKGRAIIRAKTEIDFDEIKNRGTIYITEIPYMVNKSNLILKIADLVKNKIIDSISDIKDESSRKGIRVVIKLKKGFIPEVELNKLFKLTALQSNFPINMLALINERPVTLNLKDAIKIYNNHQIDILIRKTKFELKKTSARKHILEGLNVALEDIDKVIELIKKSNDNNEAVNSLVQKYTLSEIQAKAILEMKLNRLTGLERGNLIDEINKLDALVKEYTLTIESKDVQKEKIIKMFDEMIEQYGDERRTSISNLNITNIKDEDLIPREEVAITISRKGYIKRLPIEDYRVQNRGGTGSRGATIATDDYITEIIITNTHIDLLFFTSLGKVFRLRAHEIPQLGKNAKGLPIINLLSLEKNEEVKSIISMDVYNDMELLFVTKKGIAKKTSADEFRRINKTGKRAITLKEFDELLLVSPIPKDKNINILIGNSNGKAIRFCDTDIRSMGRTASGVRAIYLENNEEVVDAASSARGNLILSLSENGFGKLTNIENYRITKRGGKGVISINTLKAGKLIALSAVKGDEDLMIITDKGTVIRTQISQISQFSRNSKGVTIVKIRPNEKIASAKVVRSSKEIENEIIEKTKEVKLDIFENKE